MSELTNEQFENLLKQAVLVHLSDDELGQYHDGATGEVTSARIVAHLRQCQMCSGRSALMKLAVATTRESDEQDSASPQVIVVALALAGVVIHRKSRSRRGERGASAESKIEDGQSADGVLRWRIVENESDGLEAQFTSQNLQLDGCTLTVRYGQLHKIDTLRRGSEDQVYAKFLFTPDELEILPDGAVLTIEDIAPQAVREAQLQVWISSGEGEAASDLQYLVVKGADESYRFLTVLDEDEAGELYLFMSISGERKGAVYSWPVEGTLVQLPFIPDETERHRYQAYLTDREVTVPEGICLDLKINDEERSEERRRLVAAFLEALESGEIGYRTAGQEIRP